MNRAHTSFGGLASYVAQYPYCICDVWGVLHQGTRAYVAAVDALTAYRHAGGKVALLTNAPMPAVMVEQRLHSLGIDIAAVADALVTSGRLTQEAIHGADKVFHWGPAKDLPLYAGKTLHPDALTANLVVVTGMLGEDADITPAASALLQQMVQANVAMVCANPDLAVQMGDTLQPCAGAVAQLYQQYGGQVAMFGKPYAPAYDLCFNLLGNPPKAQVLAIGDGLHTDIAGAQAYGIDSLWISDGVHGAQLAQLGHSALCAHYNVQPTYCAAALV